MSGHQGTRVQREKVDGVPRRAGRTESWERTGERIKVGGGRR